MMRNGDKKGPCYNCIKRHVEHGYNCHSDCPQYISYYEENAAISKIIRDKRAEDSMILDTRLKALYKTQKKKSKQGAYWKG